MCASAAARAFSTAAFTAAATRSSSIALSAGSTAFGSMVMRVTSHFPFICTFTSPPPASPSTAARASFSLGVGHRLLELLRLPHQVLDVHVVSCAAR